MEPTLYDSLEGQVALVTGANRGIGREIARGLADLDATVFAGVRDPDADVPAGTTPVELDLTDGATLSRAVDEVVAAGGGLDVLVNNAGVGGAGAPLADLETADLDRILGVNLRGPMVLTKHALEPLLASEAGRVVNLSSGVGILSDPIEDAMPAYRVSKAGLNGLTVSLERTYGDEGLLANSADPGWVATDLGGPEAPREPPEGAETPVWLARFAPGSPSGLFWKDRSVIEY
ncbi:SDR family NAD(P)-dependent oxidoreductase [Natronobiforma cellulositropha]|uniref:SDR family NAD(P)-dependent oxidoreductase n=1 Tax=Natronobiforma cellulositropha TaxID=1679076 RepID=UPI0021D5B716|nr:SDR family NAD(P)-dependent oxidoreductase [Natronobiforma cellulositropha]